jgi:shikimate 5-dehydrogenase
MLVHQGARAFTIWTDRPAPIEAMARALDAALDAAP